MTFGARQYRADAVRNLRPGLAIGEAGMTRLMGKAGLAGGYWERAAPLACWHGQFPCMGAQASAHRSTYRAASTWKPESSASIIQHHEIIVSKASKRALAALSDEMCVLAASRHLKASCVVLVAPSTKTPEPIGIGGVAA